jgi:plasmid maintenance system antidote protein VapI
VSALPVVAERDVEPRPELKAFRDLNAEAKQQGFRVPWAQRLGVIHQQFPSTATLDWNEAFTRDHELWARIMHDIIKADQAEPGRDGPRPKALDYERGLATIRQMMGQDYSLLPFPEAFAVLSRGYSLSHLARKTNISRSIVHRLLRGDEEPSAEEMAAIADAFDKHPSFFIEYRVGYITAMVHARMATNPETSIAVYRKMAHP